MDPEVVLSRMWAGLVPGQGFRVMEIVPEVVFKSRRSYTENLPVIA